MPIVQANGLNIFYEDSGPEDGPVVLMVMGLALQLIAWPQDMINDLNSAGFRTIRFDNRDIGLSEKIKGKKAPNVMWQILLSKLGIRTKAPYLLTDMANDTIGLADTLGIDQFHLVGLSMGGMIGQIVAAEHSERVKSFTAIMTSTQNPRLPGTRADVAKAMAAAGKPNATSEDRIDQQLGIWNLIGTKDGGSSQEELRHQLSVAYERNFSAAGIIRQTSAIVATGDLRKWTRRIAAPTLVIHGTADPLVHVERGKDIAAIIPGAKLHLIEDMGHDLPPKHLDAITNMTVEHVQQSQTASDTRSVA